jgi:NADH dehydrogenase
MTTNYFGIDGLAEYSYGIKSLDEVEKLKEHLHKEIKKDYFSQMHYVIVGGGPTGVELAGVLPQYIEQISKYHDLPHRKIHVDLVEASPRLLPRMPKDVSRSVLKHLRRLGVRVYLNTAVQAQTADELKIHGKPIRSHTVIWTAGMSNNPFFSDNNFQISSKGRVRVDQYLQAELGIYVLGDNADTPYSGMAQTALNDGKYVAHNLIRIVQGEEPVPYHAKKPVYVMPAGPRWAAVVWGKVRIYGLLGWWLRRAADFVAYKDYTSWPMTFSRFIAEYERQEMCPICADYLAEK